MGEYDFLGLTKRDGTQSRGPLTGALRELWECVWDDSALWDRGPCLRFSSHSSVLLSVLTQLSQMATMPMKGGLCLFYLSHREAAGTTWTLCWPLKGVLQMTMQLPPVFLENQVSADTEQKVSGSGEASSPRTQQCSKN